MDHHNFDQRRSALGQRLRSLRRAAGLTGPALAARTGISQPKISKVETGRVVPSVEDVQALAQALDASPDVTASLVEHAHGLSDQIRAWRALRRQQLAAHQDRARHLEATATEITGMSAEGSRVTASLVKLSHPNISRMIEKTIEGSGLRIDHAEILIAISVPVDRAHRRTSS